MAEVPPKTDFGKSSTILNQWIILFLKVSISVKLENTVPNLYLEI